MDPNQVRSRKSTAATSCRPIKAQPEKKLLVLDLDETLTHTRHTTFDEEADFSFTFSGQECTYYVKRRPYVGEFLERVAKMFDVMVFTASDKDYADRILNFLDPEGKCISRRAYMDSGKVLDDGYVKDLTVLGVELTKVIIIDNCPHNFRLQKSNGILIKSWYVDPKDEELSTLLPLLERLAVANDVRPIIADSWGGKNQKGSGNKIDMQNKKDYATKSGLVIGSGKTKKGHKK